MEDSVEVDPGRSDGFKVKWGRDLEYTRKGGKEGRYIWYGSIPPSEEGILASEWDARAQLTQDGVLNFSEGATARCVYIRDQVTKGPKAHVGY